MHRLKNVLQHLIQTMQIAMLRVYLIEHAWSVNSEISNMSNPNCAKNKFEYITFPSKTAIRIMYIITTIFCQIFTFDFCNVLIHQEIVII